MLGAHKTFNGKRYSIYSRHGTKKDALRAKEQAKKKGLLVRIVVDKDSYDDPYYGLYARHPKS